MILVGFFFVPLSSCFVARNPLNQGKNNDSCGSYAVSVDTTGGIPKIIPEISGIIPEIFELIRRVLAIIQRVFLIYRRVDNVRLLSPIPIPFTPNKQQPPPTTIKQNPSQNTWLRFIKTEIIELYNRHRLRLLVLLHSSLCRWIGTSHSLQSR